MFDVREIGSRMKYRRDQLDLTLDDVATAIGVAKSTIKRYEDGVIERPKLPVLHSIARALDVRPEWLLGQSDQMEDEDAWDWSGDYLKELRENSGISINEAAFRLGIPSSRYLAIEKSSSKPTVPLLFAMAQVFCTSIDLLLGIEMANRTTTFATASYTKEDIELISRYHHASPETRRIVDLALAPYEVKSISPIQSDESAG